MNPDPPRVDPSAESSFVLALQSLDEEAWTVFYARYGPWLSRLLRRRIPARVQSRFDIEDVTQAAFMEACRRLTRIEYRDEMSLRAYMFRVGLSKLQERLRHHGRIRRAVDAEAPDVDADLSPGKRSHTSTPSSIYAGKEFREDVLEAMAELGEEDRRIVWLRIIEGRPWKEVAHSLECPSETARRRFCRSLRFLAERVRKHA